MASVWASGKCKRNHDITDPSNVAFIYSTVNGVRIRKRICRACKRLYRIEYQKKSLPTYYAPRICESCGVTYYKYPSQRISLGAWRNRKYCTRSCKGKVNYVKYRDRRRDTPMPNPLDDMTLARLRALVGYDPDRDYDKEERLLDEHLGSWAA